ncbi:pilus assembly protein PapC [Herbaspirillum sp. meg3]|uniref:fimbria/pilus outer membrane usher protein n=1 Tax=Herbaspirillum sp. meg3 TaxID=2025949 RepID=UPI000B97F49C|nr:fimbria/pilus outer membrane usher protein [Herbaspirillum sp. meg3]ASU38682.1 pilus assembly protein PapC [Herbaspirillum sp. meg3]
MIRPATWIGLLAFTVSAYAYGAAQDSAETLLLEVSINGRTTELVGQFTKRQDGLFATAGELRSLGIKVPGKEDELVPISGVTSKIDLNPTALKIDMEVPMNFLNTTDIATSGKSADNVPLTENARGALLNYDLLATTSEGVHSLGGYFDGRYFSGSSVFSSTGLAYFAGSPAKSARLDTTYTYSNPRELIRYRVGDFITSGLSWTRPVRFGGAQFGTDFSLRPDLIKYPTPSLGGEAVVPSTVDLFVNGVRQLSQPVPPGPFEIRQAPIATGAGQIAVAVTDELGRQTFRTIPFYATDKLLAENLSSYTAEGGFVRRNYGLRSNNYGEFAVAGTARHGFSKMLTLETHAEAMRGMTLAGGGLVYNIDNFGVLTGAVSGSNSDAGTDQQLAVGFERSTSLFSMSLMRTLSGPNYRDIGAMEGSPVSRSSTIGTLGLNLGSFGSVSLAYTLVKSPVIISTLGNIGISNSESVTVSYFKSVSRGANLYVTGFRDFRNGGYGASIGLIMPFGDNSAGGVSVNNNNGMKTTSVQASRPTISPGDIGWQLQTSEGSYKQRYGEVDYKGTKGRASYTVAQSNNTTSQRAGVRGAVAWMDNSLFMSNWVDDSFAVVNTEGARNVGIYTENRYAGKTDGSGQLLLTDLRAYDVNKISVDVLDLPLTLQMDQNEQYVKPRDRSGVVINFKTKRTSDVNLVLKMSNGDFVPVGSSVKIRENGQQAPVGYEGAAYLSELGAVNTLDILMPSGETCQAVLIPDRNLDGGMSSSTLECH